jgi:hypothetical protein
MSTIHSPFSGWLMTSDFSSVLIVFCQLFTWIALGDTDSHFSLILVTQANGVEGELHQPHDCITDVTNAHT